MPSSIIVTAVECPLTFHLNACTSSFLYLLHSTLLTQSLTPDPVPPTVPNDSRNFLFLSKNSSTVCLTCSTTCFSASTCAISYGKDSGFFGSMTFFTEIRARSRLCSSRTRSRKSEDELQLSFSPSMRSWTSFMPAMKSPTETPNGTTMGRISRRGRVSDHVEWIGY
ncbi:hypothetical protein DM02DRAFT_134937 [Periconia macrospinosa]|uniref:Uncharacterized protein n=1 Tax=Periconia macrospinosa TaxID=97972 RepID=A0A2V1E3F8_9PLEO|nr:hypothetical protein DM02DRAFT_134937 [Periconia macrospinosa]